MFDDQIVHAALKAMELRINQGFADVMQAVRRDNANLSMQINHRITGIEARLDTAERNIKRHDSGFRQTSNQDLQHDADIAALIVAVNGTQLNLKRLSDEVTELRGPDIEQKNGSTEKRTLATLDSKANRLDRQGLASLFLQTAILLLSVILAAAKHLP